MTVDLRSDTVTRPTAAMRQAMASAEVGDDVFGDDPTVLRLQAVAANRLEKEAALFVPTGTQANLTALLSHCARGDEFLVNQEAHTYKWEGGGGAVLGGIQPQPLDFRADGTVAIAALVGKVKPDDSHFARTRLLCLENTHHGRVVPEGFLVDAAAFADTYELGLHLDGARLANAAVAVGQTLAEAGRAADTVSMCFSKGLGAPSGSVLAGPSELVDAAHRWRKMLGGGMRQSGVLAAACLMALDDHVERLADDHARAARLGDGLAELGLPVEQHTNMVFVDTSDLDVRRLVAELAQRHVTVLAGERMRLVTHLDIADGDIDHALGAFSEALEQLG